MSLIPVIMAGGTGSRLWPLSREQHPKQFLTLEGQLTMLQMTLSRIAPLDTDKPIVICNEEHRFLVAEQLREVNSLSGKIVLEPVGRNTAPAIALAAMIAQKTEPDAESPLMLVLAADHVIRDEEAFVQTVLKAMPQARAGKLITFGIVPEQPETGYGYIRKGQQIEDDIYEVAAFVEKPDYDTAEYYVKSKEYLWNSGMFLFRADVLLSELNKYRPDIFNHCAESIAHLEYDLDFIRVDKTKFTACASESIDYAVMEHTDLAAVIPLSVGWSDVGSWSSLWDISAKDERGNVARGDVIQHNCQNSYLYSDGHLVTAVGLDDTIIVQTKDATLVAKKDAVQNVKQIVQRLKDTSRIEYQAHTASYRPWGKTEVIEREGNYSVKRITINPGHQLTMQVHYHRAEHWVVVSGMATIVRENDRYKVVSNESTFIPPGIAHSLHNNENVPLVIIEVQSGSYLAEDDIIRL